MKTINIVHKINELRSRLKVFVQQGHQLHNGIPGEL